MSHTVHTSVPSPVGRLLLTMSDRALTGLYLAEHDDVPAIDPSWRNDATPFAAVTTQLEEYFSGKRRAFTLPLAPVGTDFQQTVWQALIAIPFAATASYGGLARTIARPRASRAVGSANGRNPIAIIIPCHRVIAGDGGIGGYSGGLTVKRWLLAHEANVGQAAAAR